MAASQGNVPLLALGRISYTITAPGFRPHATASSVKLSEGTDYVRGALEISGPSGWRGPWDAEAFRREAEAYYMNAVVPNDDASQPPTFHLYVGESIKNDVEYVDDADQPVARTPYTRFFLSISGTLYREHTVSFDAVGGSRGAW